jgi:glycosyltransferase involved in cell wall biosynthesis
MAELPTVLFVAVPAPLGGSNRSLATLLTSLDGQVNRVLASPAFGDFRDLVVAEGLADEVVDLPRKPGSPLDRFLRLVGGAKIAWWVIRNRGRLAAIHANALTGLNLSLPGALVNGGPTVVWIHDPVGSTWGRILGPAVRRLIPGLRIAAVSRTAESVAVDNGLCDPDDAAIVPNPISATEVLGKSASRQGTDLTIGLLGGSSHRKGFDLLPAVARQLQNESINWKLFVTQLQDAGSRAVWAELALLPEGLIGHPGKLTNVAEAYAQLDLVFCPSRNESFCRVAAEAMLNGIPVVASDIQPLRDLLGDDEAGILFPTGDSMAAAQAFKTLIDDAQMRKRMGERGRARAQKFTPDEIARQLMSLYGVSDR